MPDIVDLSRYRFEKAKEMLSTAKRDYNAEDYSSANNRAYYCIFHAMRAVLALDDMLLLITFAPGKKLRRPFVGRRGLLYAHPLTAARSREARAAGCGHR